jgi:hypothetical protein
MDWALHQQQVRFDIRERYLNHILSASADCGKLGA